MWGCCFYDVDDLRGRWFSWKSWDKIREDDDQNPNELHHNSERLGKYIQRIRLLLHKKMSSHGLKAFPKNQIKRQIFCSLYIFESSQSDIWLSSIFPNKQIMWRKTSPSCALLWEYEMNDEVFSIILILAIKMHWRYIIFYSFCTSTWKIMVTLKVPFSSQNQHHREPKIP